jgi:hypothetical protein
MFLESFFPIPSMKTPHLIRLLRKHEAKLRRGQRSRQRKKHRRASLLAEIRKKIREYCASHSGLTWALFARPKGGYPPFALRFIGGKRMPENLRKSILSFKDSLCIRLRVRLSPHPKTSANCMAFHVFA